MTTVFITNGTAKVKLRLPLKDYPNMTAILKLINILRYGVLPVHGV